MCSQNKGDKMKDNTGYHSIVKVYTFVFENYRFSMVDYVIKLDIYCTAENFSTSAYWNDVHKRYIFSTQQNNSLNLKLEFNGKVGRFQDFINKVVGV